MKSLPLHCRHALLLSLLLLAACASDSPMGPSAPADAPASLEATTPEWLVYSPDGADPIPMLRELGVATAKLRPERGLVLVRSEDALDRVVAKRKGGGPRWIVERNDPVELVEVQELNQGFFESWDPGQIEQQDGLGALDLPLAHAVSTGAGVRVAVVDTGIDPDHPQLAGNVEWYATPSLGLPVESANGIDDDGDGLVDEGFGHGTHVAGLILAVAPDVTVLPVKVFFEEGFCTEYHLALALQDLMARDVDVINLSMRLTGVSPVVSSLLSALSAQGKLVVAAAGNQAAGVPAFPASHAGVLAVAASDENDVLADFSNYGDVEFAAAGVGMLSSYPDDGMVVASGTSMACAVATGSLALLLEASVPDPVSVLRGTATAITPPTAVGDGRVDPVGALGLR